MFSKNLLNTLDIIQLLLYNLTIENNKEAATMSAKEMSNKVQELRELKRMQEELQAEIDAVQDAIKAEMAAQNVDTLTGADYKITWKEVVSSRLDTTALKKALPEVAARFMKQSSAKRFVLA